MGDTDLLREVAPSDIDALFAQRTDDPSARMAMVPPPERADYQQRWAAMMDDPEVVARVIVDGETVLGHIVSWVGQDGRRMVGYWIARAFWGRRFATRALEAFLEVVPDRPLFAVVSAENAASIRVLRRAGFTETGSEVRQEPLLGEYLQLAFALTS